MGLARVTALAGGTGLVAVAGGGTGLLPGAAALAATALAAPALAAPGWAPLLRLRAGPRLIDLGHFLLELLLLLQKLSVLLEQLAHLRLHFLQLLRQRIDLPLLG